MNTSFFIAKVRIRLARLVNYAILGSRVGGLPFNLVRSLEEMGGRPFADKYLVEMRKVSPAQVIRYAFPEDYPPLFRRGKAFDAKYVYVLKNVIVAPESGAAWTPNGRILQESVGSLQRLMGWGGVLHEILLTQSKKLLEEAITACPDTGYFHWLLEIMPNMLDALAVVPNARILVSPNRSGYVSDALEAFFGKDMIAERCLVRPMPHRCERFVLSSCEAFSGFVPPRSVELLRKAFQPKAESEVLPEGKKIYILRRGVAKRVPENEEELEDALKDIGFEVVRLEQLKFQEQIRLMSQASIIVAMHGAGLANMIWARNPCRVVEVFPIGCYNDCFARLALTCGFDYRMVPCQFEGQGFGRIPVQEVTRLVRKHENRHIRTHSD